MVSQLIRRRTKALAGGLAIAAVGTVAVIATQGALAAPPAHAPQGPPNGKPGASLVNPGNKSQVTIRAIGTYESGVFDESAAEIVKHAPLTQRLFVVNANAPAVDVLDVSDPSNPVKAGSITAGGLGAAVNSVDVYNGVLAAAIEHADVDGNGRVGFYDTATLTLIHSVEVGVLPDMVTFTPDGTKVLTANEGEPAGDLSVDPEGSVSIIDVSGGIASATAVTADFQQFNGQEDALRAQGIRIFTPGSSAAQDFEPEYIAVSADSSTAWVALQENNAVAVLDIASGVFTDIWPLGYKDHNVKGNGFDASNRDGIINIQTWPTLGMYQPDAITSFKAGGAEYIITANEGDARDYSAYSEEARVKDLVLNPDVFPNWEWLQQDENLGRLTTTTANGDTNGDGMHEEIYSFGARSFSIWDASGNLVFDSGDQFEQITAALIPDNFNSNNDENGSFDSRSDDKGPEPEAVTIGKVNGRTLAFIGLERVGGVMIYDVTAPRSPRFLNYVNNRDFSGDAEAGTAGDLGPEAMAFIPASDSPTGEALLVVSNEVSGTTTVFEVLENPSRVKGKK